MLELSAPLLVSVEVEDVSDCYASDGQIILIVTGRYR